MKNLPTLTKISFKLLLLLTIISCSKDDFEGESAWVLNLKERNLTIADDEITAWFDEKLELNPLRSYRGSGVLRLNNGQWQIEQYIMSVPIPNEKFEQVQSCINANQT